MTAGLRLALASWERVTGRLVVQQVYDHQGNHGQDATPLLATGPTCPPRSWRPGPAPLRAVRSHRMGGIEVVDERYRALWDRVRAVLGADPRVRSVALSGSVADGTADAWSDLDVQVISVPDHHDALVADWPLWLAAITPTVFARTPIAPFVINAVTAEGLTLDVAIWAGEAPAGPFTPTEYTVGQLSGQRFASVADALEYAVAEQLRGMAGPFISLIQREEHVRHLAGVPHLLGLLTTVFLAETSAPPPAKHWNRTFTEEQRATVAALPPVRATRDDLIAFGLASAEQLMTRARPLFERFGLVWPAELAAVVADRVAAELALDVRSWCR